MNFETNIARQEGIVPFDSSSDAEEQRKKRQFRIVMAIFGLMIAAFLAFKLLGGKGGDGQEQAKQAPSVTVIVPGKQLVEGMVSATGTIAARREMPVGVVGEGGMVSRVWVEPGAWVQAGQVLASIERSVQSQEAAQLAANIRVAQADARLAQAELERAQALVGRGFISKSDLDRKAATRDAAMARVRVAQAQLGANSARIGRLDIRAPAGGLVLTRNIEPGQVVGPGSGVLFRLAKGGEMELRAQLSEADLARMSNGLSARVTPVGSGKSFTGQIWQMSPVIDPQSRQGTVRIALSYDPELRPGGFASASIISGTVDAPLLPEAAVHADEKGSYVYVVGKDNKVVRRDVRIGSVTDQGVTVASGLNGMEQVVATAGGFLNPGESVIPVKQKPAR